MLLFSYIGICSATLRTIGDVVLQIRFKWKDFSNCTPEADFGETVVAGRVVVEEVLDGGSIVQESAEECLP